MRSARRELKTIGRRLEVTTIGHCGHLERGFRTIQKRVEHLRIEVAGLELFLREAVVVPNGGGR